MTRTVPSALLTALAQPEVHPFYAVEMDFDTAPLRFWTGYGDRTIGADTYNGAGSLLAISGLDEVNDLSAKSVTISLSGVVPIVSGGVQFDLVSLALQEPYQRRSCKIYFGTTDTTTPIEIFAGLMNTMTIQDGGESSTIELVIESKLVQLERSSNRRYTDANHQSRHNGDTFFSYVADLQDKSIIWGRESV